VKFWSLTPTLNHVLRLAILKTILKRRKKKRININTTTTNNKEQASAEVETQAATSGVLTTWGPLQGRNTNMHPFLGPAKGVKKVRLQTSTKTAHHCLCWCCFSQKFFICWLNRPMCTTSNHSTEKPDLAADCLTLLPDMMTFIALVLQMGHERHTTWLLVEY